MPATLYTAFLEHSNEEMLKIMGHQQGTYFPGRVLPASMTTRHWALIPEVRAGTESREGSGAAAEGHYAGPEAQQPRGTQTQSVSPHL